MFTTRSGRSFGNPQVGRAIDRGEAHKSRGEAPHLGREGGAEHSKESHGPGNLALHPHPETGVTHVHIMHHGDGHPSGHVASVHAFHGEGSQPETSHHTSLADAHDMAQQHLPPGEHEEPDGDEGGALNAMAGGLNEDADEYGA